MRFVTAIVFGLIIFMISSLEVKAQKQTPAPAESYPVIKMEVGDTFAICKSGYIVCPARNPICDDASIVKIVDTPDGMGFNGIAKGETVCSVRSATAIRFIFSLVIE